MTSTTSTLASWAYPLQDGIWMIVWRGERCSRSFKSLDAAMQHIDDCDSAGEVIN